MKKIICLLGLAAINIPNISAKEIFYKTNKEFTTNNIESPLVAEYKKIKTIIIEGFGSSVPDAAQNAAKNALMQVVGSFVDTETMLKMQTKLNSGINSESKVDFKFQSNEDYKEVIREYSQGSIKSFQILDTRVENELYVVKARVDIRVEDFKAYVKKLAYGSKDVSINLFAKAAAETDNLASKYDLLINKIFKPVRNGEVYKIEIDQPINLVDFWSSDYCKKNPSYSYCKSNGALSGWNTKTTFIFPFQIKLKKNFQENIINILDNISDQKKIAFSGTSPNLKLAHSKNDHLLTIFDTNLPQAKQTIYRINDIYEYMRDKYNEKELYNYWIWNLHKNSEQYNNDVSYFNPIRIKLLDSYGNVLYAKQYSVHSNLLRNVVDEYRTGTNLVEVGWYGVKTCDICYGLYQYLPRFSLWAGGINREQVIFTSRKYLMALDIKLEMLRELKKVEIDFVDN
ncbi:MULTISPECIES: hypothetical protein [Prochlorococcus]|uniref:hypothetical protein n=1 Tax=Prochlorococcus TaxID=1218 RepID=UPI000533B12E|nr:MULTISPECIES: hypothetical protein [Prochlorococcus]KGG12089.1 hypothetical protein EV05_1292 [Prochlorococcus sp. MIT 0601]